MLEFYKYCLIESQDLSKTWDLSVVRDKDKSPIERRLRKAWPREISSPTGFLKFLNP